MRKRKTLSQLEREQDEIVQELRTELYRTEEGLTKGKARRLDRAFALVNRSKKITWEEIRVRRLSGWRF